MIFSVPNFKHLLEQCATSILNFEHTIYLSEEYIDELLLEFGFRTNEKKYFEKHSIVYDTEWTGSVAYNRQFKDMYALNKKLFQHYIHVHIEKIRALNDALKKIEGKAFLFGAHISSQFYLAFGLDVNRIGMILDNDSSKWGKRLAGSSLHVETPQILESMKDSTVILPLSPYAAEIKEKLVRDFSGNIRVIEMTAL